MNSTPKFTIDDLNNIGIVRAELTEEQLAPVKAEIAQIQRSFATATPMNSGLAGNIEHEYELLESHDYLEQFLLPLIAKYDEVIGYMTKSIKVLGDNKAKIKLGKAWVNFQQKHEFNPLHDHSGVMSFVIWIDVPYDIRDEMARKPSRNAHVNVPGHFSLVTLNSIGNLITYNLPVDRTYNNRMLMFPASMHHCVYPFYTSDEFRISVAGNFVLEPMAVNTDVKPKLKMSGLDDYLTKFK